MSEVIIAALFDCGYSECPGGSCRENVPNVDSGINLEIL